MKFYVVVLRNIKRIQKGGKKTFFTDISEKKWVGIARGDLRIGQPSWCFINPNSERERRERREHVRFSNWPPGVALDVRHRCAETSPAWCSRNAVLGVIVIHPTPSWRICCWYPITKNRAFCGPKSTEPVKIDLNEKCETDRRKESLVRRSVW